jgi:molecular chaperone DnaK (HSP70)
LLAAVLRTVATTATEAAGHLPPAILTHPAAWGPPEEAVLRDAATGAGFPDVLLVPEPVAAASTVTAANVLVVDVGARAFDVTVVREGIIAGLGGDRAVGGRRVDAAIAAHLAGTTGALGATPPEVWAVIDRPKDVQERRDQRAFWNSVRAAKEALSSAETAPVLLPGVDEPFTLDRGNLDRLAGPLVDSVADAARKVVGDAGLHPSELDAVLLIGGSARLEVLGPAVREALAIEPRLSAEPEFTAATGALARLADALPAVPARRVLPVPAGAPRGPYLWPAAAGLAVLLVLLVLALLLG